MRIIPFLLGLSLYNISQAQLNPEDFITPSPNPAAISKFGDIPVSYHTGVANISIPIYEISQGELKVAISLDYHSSGIRVDEVASWVGLGWRLSAGGVISRIVRGGPDEGFKDYGDNVSDCWGNGWWSDGMPDCLNTCTGDPNCPFSYDLSDPRNENDCWNRYTDVANGLNDTESDIYTINVGGYSAKFIFDEHRNVFMVPISDLKIIRRTSHSWEVITPDGIKYFFGGTNATEHNYVTSSGNVRDNKISSSAWYLTRIETPRGNDFIEFNYTAEAYGYGNRIAHISQFDGAGKLKSQITPYIASTNLNTNSVEAVRLSSITTSSGLQTVTFHAEKSANRTDLTGFNSVLSSTGINAKAIDKIEINYGNRCKIFDLSLSYFTSTSESSLYNHDFDTRRLRLDYIDEYDCYNHNRKHYSFTYNSMSLPRRYSLARDHWGYYNGQHNNDGLIHGGANKPWNRQKFSTGDNRNPNETYCKAGILERIDYPTGGFTTFEYELHHDGKQSVGGLRVKKIVDNSDSNSPDVVKYIEYESPSLYAGVPTYVNPQLTLNRLDFNCNMGVVNMNFGYEISSAQSNYFQSTHSYHIGYGKVAVSTPGRGKTVYLYRNNSPNPTDFHLPTPPLIAVAQTGRLIKKEFYNKSEDLVAYEQYEYGMIDYGRYIKQRMVKNYNQHNPGWSRNTMPVWNDYNIYTFRYELKKKIVFQDGIKTEYIYDYPETSINHNNYTSETYYNSEGQEIKIEYSYIPETPWILGDIWQDYNIKNFVVETKKYIDGVQNYYNYKNIKLENSFIRSTKFLEYPTNDSDFEIIQNYYYDETNNRIKQITSQNGINHFYYWDKNGEFPIAHAISSGEFDYYDFAFNSFEIYDTRFWIYNNHYHAGPGNSKTGNYSLNLSSSLRSKYHFTGKYNINFYYKDGTIEVNSGSIISETEKPLSDGWIFKNILLDFNNEQLEIVGIDAKGESVKLDEIRVMPENASITTYIYNGLELMESINENNEFIRYHYDDLSRLVKTTDMNNNIIQLYEYNYKQ
jgi:YD repeat-containing protein